MISNGHSLTFVINTIFAIFNSIGISKIPSNHVVTRFQNSFTTGQARYNEEFLDEENKFKTYDELKNQLNCKLNFLKYFSLISMIKSKNVTNITNAEMSYTK
jgi:hypothetical protein